MAGTTTNNGWDYPTSTDLVKDGALNIQTLAQDIDTSTGKGLIAWQAYTPTLTNVTLGTGSVSFVYCQLGKIVHVRGVIALAGTGAVGGSGFVDFTLPVAPTAPQFLAPMGQAQFYNGTSIFNGQILYISGSTGRLTCQTTSGTYSTATDIQTNVPFAWGSGATRQMFVNMTYQAA